MQRQFQDNERIELKEAPPGMRNYWCTIVRENYKMLLGRPGQGVKGADRRKEVIARLGQVLGQGGGGGGRVERKLSLPISILSPGKPTLKKGQASDPLLVTKSSIRRRFWADPRRIHHNLHGIHYNLHGIHHNLGGMHHEPQGKHPQLQVEEQAAGRIANDIVAELKRGHFDGGQNKIDRQVLWGSFKEGGRRIWQTAPDSGENYISQEVTP